MMAIEMLEREAAGLPEESLQKVFEYIQFLKYNLRSAAEREGKESTRRTPGGLVGPLVMADDFDEIPDCFKEYV